MDRSPKKSTRYVLAIDLGSGSLKAAVVSDRGEVVSSAESNITSYLLQDGGGEQDPVEWWNAAKQTARQVIR